ncbi:MAG: MFS transporter [Syntrophaceae bacterium]|nr:MFS transporter [Syntrophaceae bacterium]
MNKKNQYTILFLLLGANLLNYIDRQILYAVFPLIKIDFNLSDTELGFLGSAFMFTYMIIAPFFGWLGDHTKPNRLASGGLAFWSLATAMSGLAGNYLTLLVSRSLVGVGEASFGVVSPGILSQTFSKEVRGRILSFFYLAIPTGSAMGYLFGGMLGYHFGWPAAFLLVAIPGFLLAIPTWRICGIVDAGRPKTSDLKEGFSLKPYMLFCKNRSYVYNALAMAAMTFALGGLAQWIPMFIYRYHHLNVMEANTLFGVITVIAGISGTLLGGFLGDLLQRKTPKGYLIVSAAGFALSIPCCIFAILTPNLTACMTAIFLSECLLFLNTGPLNTVIVNVSSPLYRATAFALNIFIIHALGDAISPTIIGCFSDRFGLRQAMLIAPLFIFLALIFCLICCRYIKQDMSEAEKISAIGNAGI